MGMLHRQRIAQGLDPHTGEPVLQEKKVEEAVVEAPKKEEKSTKKDTKKTTKKK